MNLKMEIEEAPGMPAELRRAAERVGLVPGVGAGPNRGRRAGAEVLSADELKAVMLGSIRRQHPEWLVGGADGPRMRFYERALGQLLGAGARGRRRCFRREKQTGNPVG